ncbi:MAG: SMP-30/gluconolactonase/LRE family protein [Rhodobacteraceae bacterium]|nr:SMP-30/gluconolactonase/LRE family protein [Paracoccaceae bacterium]
MTVTILDDTRCALGEGPLWHPERGQFFWFDILGNRLHTVEGGQSQFFQFDRNVSAAGWVSRDEMLIASETDFFLFNLTTGTQTRVVALEDDRAETRSNDGRVDPYGGFWIGTMGKNAEPQAGAIYRYYRGEVRKLFPRISIPNAMCFSPGGDFAYFCDTPTGQVMRQALDPANGWPQGDPEVWLDLRAESLNPDGSVVDAQGNFWNAQWGAHRVACYDPQGHFIEAVEFPAAHTSCPAFGGPELSTLFCTSAQQGLSAADIVALPTNGATFSVADVATGQAEHQVIL